ncbi:MAG: hypothetical protein KH828_02065 [Clostridiales bacterium]|nr:hypothetical protein [Clostridiales bacterium]
MTFYKDEKKRIGGGIYAFLAFALFLIYGEIQGQIPSPFLRESTDPVKVIEFTNSAFLLTCIFLPIYLNDKLFFLKERGESVYLISKYTVVPITKKQLYGTKLWILVETMLLFFILSTVVYFAVLASNDYWLLNGEVLLTIGKGFGMLLLLTVPLTLFNLYHGIHLEKAAAY